MSEDAASKVERYRQEANRYGELATAPWIDRVARAVSEGETNACEDARCTLRHVLRSGRASPFLAVALNQKRESRD
jgi:hypothetical protein